MIAAGVILRRVVASNGLKNQNLLNGNLKKITKGKKIIGAGKSLSALPLVDGLRSIEAKVILQVSNGISAAFPKLLNVGPGSRHINDGECLKGRHEIVPPCQMRLCLIRL